MSELIKQTIGAGGNLLVRRPAGMVLIGDASGAVDMIVRQRGSEIFRALGANKGLKVRPVMGFDEVEVQNNGGAAVALELYVTSADVDVQIDRAPLTDTQLRASPVNVNAVGATLTASNVTIGLCATAADSTAALASNGAVTNFCAANTARRILRVKNIGSADVALTSNGVTAFANAVIVLQPGELWVESEAPGAAWYARTDGTAASAIAYQTGA